MALKSGKDRNVSSLEGEENQTRKSGRNKIGSKFGPVLYEICEGKRLESKIYPKSEFSKLSRRQKSVVVKLTKQRRQNTRNRNSNSHKD